MNYRRFLACIAALAALLITYSFVSVEDPIDRIRQQLDRWVSAHPVEKVYLQFDKPYYAAGDDIWFKAYVVAGPDHRLSTLSGVVNVDLLDAGNVTKQSIKLQLANGVAAGDFALPDTLRGGNYHIRAYTNYMRNAGNEYFFDHAFTILSGMASKGPSGNITVAAGSDNKQSIKPDIQFFPESGYLVNGLPSQVAFKAVGSNGLGADVHGVVVDGQGKQVASFNSTHLGMGKFNLTPVAGGSYVARITTSDGTQMTVPLSKVQDRGYVMTVTDNGPNVTVNISASRTITNSASAPSLTLVGQSSGRIYFSSTGKPGSTAFTTTISKEKFPSGIARFTLFTAGGEPLNERLVFINNNKLALTFSASNSYSPRQKVKIGVIATNDGKPVAGNFSVSVTDESKVPVNENTENNILASLLLTSDLRGYVEQPAYYFNSQTNKVQTELDLLMLTQGYHRFDWREVINGSSQQDTYNLEKALQISGTITSPDGKPVAGGKVEVIDIDNIDYTLDTLTDANGRFSFTNLAFDDSLRLIVQARNAKNKRDVVIHLDSIAPLSKSTGKIAPDLSIDIHNELTVYSQSAKALYVAQRQYNVGNHVIPLQEVVIREKKQALKHSANLNGPGNADQVLLAHDMRNYGCVYLADCLQGRLLGVIFRNGIPYSTRGYRPMQVILDGVYVQGDFINTININDVAGIEVLRNAGTAGIYGGRAANGVIVITTKRGDEPETYAGPITGRGIKAFYPKGYYKARTFYSPRYDAPKENKQLADLRTTIYWNPNVTTSADGKTAFEYFNAGSRGKYRVVVEGIDSEGNVGRQVYRYNVE
ncbi:TonB-dependent receptor [Mucilaginibacter terrenus]|uniref:TonB-dependent receptor n=1 Tax=Mucilaginibacter terrenus TaxID=2482727 RepID=A0A3E2NJL3_9SPHI|nr:carboxypeptidase regulatory-like domain-containing protein [Mucilaginibacter terrenus]RFZ81187.1 TonB-dependent receptor [Mucilaginibacter terrenus]